MKPRVIERNRDLFIIQVDDRTIGQVRRGLDNQWYPELQPEFFRSAAVQALLIAHEAIESYVAAVHGDG